MAFVTSKSGFLWKNGGTIGHFKRLPVLPNDVSHRTFIRLQVLSYKFYSLGVAADVHIN